MKQLQAIINICLKYQLFIIIPLLFVLTFVPRLYRFNNPIADWHSWRQADTAAVTRNFVQEGYTPFFPKFDTMNSLNETQTPNPKRYFFAEFPLYNSAVYIFYRAFHHFTLEQWGRIISILSSSFATICLYFLVREYSNKRIAFFSALFFAILPYNIYYGRVIMPDPMHILFSILTLYLVTIWLKTEKWYFSLLAGLACTVAVLTKPYALVLLLPIAYLFFTKWQFKTVLKPWVYIFAAIGLFPLFLWRQHINNYPEGMFGTTWLYNQGNIRFTGAYFRWLIYDRMNRLIFATGGFALFWIGFIKGYAKKEGLFYYLWFAAIWLFFIVIAKGNVTHDYYQMPLVPVGCIFMAIGLDVLLTSGHTLLQRGINIFVAFVLVLTMLAFGWYEVRDYFNINHPEIVQAGQWVDTHLPKNATVIAPYDEDPAFLYQTNRIGWTFGRDKIPQFIKEGAQYLVSVNYDDDTNYWMKKCTVVEKNPSFVVVDLRHCK